MPSNRTLKPVHANRGIAARYRRSLCELIEEMHNSVLYWVTARYRAAPPALAMDARSTPSRAMQGEMRRLAARWVKRFEDAAPRIAEAYLRDSFKATDSAMRAALKDAGLSVQFKMTAAVRDAFNASLEENIGLIRSIPQKYLQEVQGSVMRSYSTGRDLATTVRDIKRLYPKASNRAVLIARDQSNKANAVVVQARQKELGIVKAQWMHSAGGKEPRPDHVAASGKIYDVAKGCLISGEYILPGQLINCRCVSRSIVVFG